MSRMDNKEFRANWGKHPGRNPLHRESNKGNRFYEKSRWVPHVGAKEMAKIAARQSTKEV